MTAPAANAVPFADALLDRCAPEPAFDRFYFNLHGAAAEALLVLGAGVYPPAAVVDGYVCAVLDRQQRNLRVSTELDPARPTEVGPLTWQVLEPLCAWRLELRPNPSGIELDVIWRARAPAYATRRYQVHDEQGHSDHAHFFQSGRYEGRLRIDGRRIDVGGWFGQRDRSRGARRTRDRLGMHLWVQAQFATECVGFLFNEDREGRPTHCDGALMREDGTLDRILGVRHCLLVGDDLEVTGGRLALELESGSRRLMAFAAQGRGIYMAGGGFAGWQGQPRGRGHLEHERWPLDGGTYTPRSLPIGIVNALCTFQGAEGAGSGVFEYALSRSASYRYAPTLE